MSKIKQLPTNYAQIESEVLGRPDDQIRSIIGDISQKVRKVSVDDNATLFVTTDGVLYGIGTVPNFQNSKSTSPFKIDTGGDLVADARVGFQRVMIVMEDGTIRATGTNHYTALGLDDQKDYPMTTLPTKNHNNERVKFVSIAYSHTICITEMSKLYVFGQIWYDPANSYVQTKSQQFDLQHITCNNKQIVDVQSGAFHLAILNNAGEVFTGGNTSDGRLCSDCPQYYGFQKVNLGHVYSAIFCLNDTTLLGTTTGKLVACGRYGGESTLNHQFGDVKEEISSICCNAYSGAYGIGTASGRMLLVPEKSEAIEITRGDYLFGLVQQSKKVWYLLPFHKRCSIQDHFSLLSKVLVSDRFQDVIIIT
jgi:hypothetical protein